MVQDLNCGIVKPNNYNVGIAEFLDANSFTNYI